MYFGTQALLSLVFRTHDGGYITTSFCAPASEEREVGQSHLSDPLLCLTDGVGSQREDLDPPQLFSTFAMSGSETQSVAPAVE